MKSAYKLKETFTLWNYNTTITRAEFEARFTATRETVTFTFHGWDGKSYDGESRRARVLRSNEPGFEAYKFIKVGKSVHYIDEDYLVLEKATGERHPARAGWWTSKGPERSVNPEERSRTALPLVVQKPYKRAVSRRARSEEHSGDTVNRRKSRLKGLRKADNYKQKM